MVCTSSAWLNLLGYQDTGIMDMTAMLSSKVARLDRKLKMLKISLTSYVMKKPEASGSETVSKGKNSIKCEKVTTKDVHGTSKLEYQLDIDEYILEDRYTEPTVYYRQPGMSNKVIDHTKLHKSGYFGNPDSLIIVINLGINGYDKPTGDNPTVPELLIQVRQYIKANGKIYGRVDRCPIQGKNHQKVMCMLCYEFPCKCPWEIFYSIKCEKHQDCKCLRMLG